MEGELFCPLLPSSYPISIIGRLDSCSGCSVYVEALHLLTVTSPLSDWMYIPVFSPGLLHSSWVLGERLSCAHLN